MCSQNCYTLYCSFLYKYLITKILCIKNNVKNTAIVLTEFKQGIFSQQLKIFVSDLFLSFHPKGATILNFLFIMFLLFLMVLFNILVSLNVYEININDITLQTISCNLLFSFYFFVISISMKIADRHLFLLLNSLI